MPGGAPNHAVADGCDEHGFLGAVPCQLLAVVAGVAKICELVTASGFLVGAVSVAVCV